MDNAGFYRRLLAITVLALALRVYGLASQPLTCDDIGVAFTALNYMEDGRLGPVMWNHPGLRNVLVYFSMGVLGGTWGLRAVSLALGTLSVPLLAAAARGLLKNDGAALMAALFLALDPLHIDYSRQALQEVYMAFFALGGIALALDFRDRGGPLPLLLSGVSFGLGIASKWYAAFPLTVTLLYLSYAGFKGRGAKAARLLSVLSAMVLVPLAVYLLTFLPWAAARGYGIADWLFLQRAMAYETATHAGYNPYSLLLDHKAYLWFIKPVAYVDLIDEAGKTAVLYGISNPLVWLLTLPSVAYVAYRGVRLRGEGCIYLVGLFAFSYLPFLPTGRPIWAHTAFSVLPFAFMAVAYTVLGLAEGRRHGRALVAAYLLAAAAASVPLYLLAIGKGAGSGWAAPIVRYFGPRL